MANKHRRNIKQVSSNRLRDIYMASAVVVEQWSRRVEDAEEEARRAKLKLEGKLIMQQAAEKDLEQGGKK